MRLRELKSDEVSFTVKVEEECCVPVKGNAIDSGDEDFDRNVENEILDRLRRGDSFAWCSILVTAEWNGHKGIASLGCCSLEGESDVETTINDHGMRDEALDDLNKGLQAEADTLSELET